APNRGARRLGKRYQALGLAGPTRNGCADTGASRSFCQPQTAGSQQAWISLARNAQKDCAGKSNGGIKMTKSNANGSNATIIHMSLQGKGGVGKSLVAAILSQYLGSRGQDVHGIDADPVNHTFSEYRGLG